VFCVAVPPKVSGTASVSPAASPRFSSTSTSFVSPSTRSPASPDSVAVVWSSSATATVAELAEPIR